MTKQGYGSLPGVDDVENPASGSDQVPSDAPSIYRQMKAEMYGTAILVMIGCGGLCAGTYLNAFDGLWQECALWILGAFLGISLAAPISGAHLNPAVTLAMALWRPDDFPWSSVIPYWIAQLVGAIGAGITNLIIYYKAIENYDPDYTLKSASCFGDYYSLSEGVSGTTHAFVLEFIGTGFLTFVIFAVTNKKNNIPEGLVAPLIAITIGLMIALLGNLTGGGINPARDLGPRLVTRFYKWGPESMTGAWVYIVAPLLGGLGGGFEADWLFSM